MGDKKPRLDWRGADLRSLNFQGVDLEGADLRGADLRGVNFANMNLRYADLRGATAHNANFQNACLYGAKMQGIEAQMANFQGADMRMANIAGAYMEGSMMSPPAKTLSFSDLLNGQSNANDAQTAPSPERER